MFRTVAYVVISTIGFQLTHVVQPHHSQCKRVAEQPCCTKNIRSVLILCNRLCKLSISTIRDQPVAQHAMLRNMIDREWAPLRHCMNVSYVVGHECGAVGGTKTGRGK
jgi:hypothetical protein